MSDEQPTIIAHLTSNHGTFSVPELAAGETAVLIRETDQVEGEGAEKKLVYYTVLYVVGPAATNLSLQLPGTQGCYFVKLPKGIDTPLKDLDGLVSELQHPDPPGKVKGQVKSG
jgi:hypothetical protein